MFPSFCAGSADRPDCGGAAAVGAGSCPLHVFLQEEVRSPLTFIVFHFYSQFANLIRCLFSPLENGILREILLCPLRPLHTSREIQPSSLIMLMRAESDTEHK